MNLIQLQDAGDPIASYLPIHVCDHSEKLYPNVSDHLLTCLFYATIKLDNLSMSRYNKSVINRKGKIMPRFSDDMYDVTESIENMGMDELINQLEQEEEDEYYRAMGPRAFGPDRDEDE